MDDLIYAHISQDKEIAAMLASYQGAPAFFFQKAPSDTDREWDGKSCFPRADYSIEKIADFERNTAGILTINIWVNSIEIDSVVKGLPTEEDDSLLDKDKVLEQTFKDLLSGTFFTANGVTTCILWRSSGNFLSRSSDKNMETHAVETFGVEMYFDLIEFPVQTLTDPDPVMGCNEFLKSLLPEGLQVGYDKMPPVWKPEGEEMGFYWRFGGFTSDSVATYAASWYSVTLALHIFVDDRDSKNIERRNQVLKWVMETLRTRGEVILLDDSPLFVKDLVGVSSGDPLRQGQLKLSGYYGVLERPRKEVTAPPIKKVSWR